MDKKKLREFLKIIIKIEEDEVFYPTKKEDENDPSTWSDLISWDFNLTIPEFERFVLGLNKSGIINITNGSPIYSPKYVEEAYDKHGDVIKETVGFMLAYINVDLVKLTEYKEVLKNGLSIKEANEFLYKSGIGLPYAGAKLYKSLGILELFSDDTIRINGVIVSLSEKRLRNLCKVFIEAGYEAIAEEDIINNLRIQTRRPNKTIGQYISDLNKELKPHFGKLAFVKESQASWRPNFR